jgi:predicted permease
MFRRDRRLSQEIRFHIEQQTARNIRDGMAPEEARRAALVAFGGVESAREAARDEMRGAWTADLVRDVRVGVRTLGRAPGFALAAILTFSLGIAASVAMFSVFEGVLLRPLPYPDSDRIVRLYQVNSRGLRGSVSEPNFNDWRDAARSFNHMAEMAWLGPTPVVAGADAQMAGVTAVSAGFFDAMGVRPALGRGFLPPEQQENGVQAAIVSAAFWKAWRGAARPAGEVVRSGSLVFTVVGVMPAGFDYPGRTAIWIARELQPPQRSRTAHNFTVVARLAPGVALDAAQQEISALSRALKVRYGDDTWMEDAAAVPLLDSLTSSSRPTLQMLLAAAFILLLVSISSVSNLLLARGAARRREFAVQLAIGASVGRIGRQLFAETLVLCLAGAGAGVALGVMAVRLFAAMGPASVQRLDTVTVSWPAVALAVGITMLAVLGLTALTAAGTRRIRVLDALGDAGRGASSGRGRLRARETLVVSQAALTVVLLAGAALLGRSMQAVLAISPGFSLDDALVADVTMASGGGASAKTKRVAFQEELIARLRALPDVTHAGLINDFPLGGRWYSNGVFIEMSRPDEITGFAQFNPSDPAIKPRVGEAGFRVVSGDYFKAMGIPLLRGRLIDDRDAPNAPHVAVISESLARARWPDRDPIGRWIQFGNMDGDLRAFRVVGVVGDVRELSPEAQPGPLFYGASRQRPGQAASFSVIVRGPAPGAIRDRVRRIVREIDPEVPVTIRTMAEAFDTVVVNRRFNLWLVAAFGLVALLLATLGVYGLVSYTVEQRTREMGIRLALGARPRQLLGLVVRRGVVLASIGAGAGLALAWGFAGVMDSLVYGVSPGDPPALAASSAVLVLAAVAASYLPARAIVRRTPAGSLRDV